MFKNLFVGLRRFEDTIQTDPRCFPPRHGGCPPLGPHFCVPMARSPPAHWPAQMEAVLPVGLGAGTAPPSAPSGLGSPSFKQPRLLGTRHSGAALVRMSLCSESACKALSVPAQRAPG